MKEKKKEIDSNSIVDKIAAFKRVGKCGFGFGGLEGRGREGGTESLGCV